MDPCKSVIYSAYVMNRGKFEKQAVPSSQVSGFFFDLNIKLMNFYNNRSGYIIHLKW